MAVRIQTYLGLLYQDLIRTEQLSASGLLPPVLPIVLYNGVTTWNAALEVDPLIDVAPPGLDAYRPRQGYLLIDERRLVEQGAVAERNLSAALFRLEASRSPAEVMRILHALLIGSRHRSRPVCGGPSLSGLAGSFFPGGCPASPWSLWPTYLRCTTCCPKMSKAGPINGNARV